MDLESASSRTLTREEIISARNKAIARTKELAEKAFGPNDTLDRGERHSKKSYAGKVATLANLFLARNEDTGNLNASSLFGFLNDCIASANEELDADVIREYLAGAEQLLTALDLKQQFIEYNRSLKKKPSTIKRQ